MSESQFENNTSRYIQKNMHRVVTSAEVKMCPVRKSLIWSELEVAKASSILRTIVKIQIHRRTTLLTRTKQRVVISRSTQISFFFFFFYSLKS